MEGADKPLSGKYKQLQTIVACGLDVRSRNRLLLTDAQWSVDALVGGAISYYVPRGINGQVITLSNTTHSLTHPHTLYT